MKFTTLDDAYKQPVQQPEPTSEEAQILVEICERYIELEEVSGKAGKVARLMGELQGERCGWRTSKSLCLFWHSVTGSAKAKTLQTWAGGNRSRQSVDDTRKRMIQMLHDSGFSQIADALSIVIRRR